jgi:hypothetical protein
MSFKKNESFYRILYNFCKYRVPSIVGSENGSDMAARVAPRITPADLLEREFTTSSLLSPRSVTYFNERGFFIPAFSSNRAADSLLMCRSPLNSLLNHFARPYYRPVE